MKYLLGVFLVLGDHAALALARVFGLAGVVATVAAAAIVCWEITVGWRVWRMGHRRRTRLR